MTRGAMTAWMRVHTWSSLVCTAFLLFLCVTGLPLIFHEEIDAAVAAPQPLPAVAAGTRPLDLDALVARAVRAGGVPLYMSFDSDRPVVNVTTGPAPDAAPATMRFQSLDRRTGVVLPPREGGVMDTVLRLHTDLMLGPWAEYGLGAMAVMFVVAIVSGIVLYAPFMRRLPFATIRHGRSAHVRRLDRHNLLGIVTMLWAGVVALTGTINTLVVPVTEWWKADQLAAFAHPGEPVATRDLASLQRAFDRAHAATPGMRAQFVAFPGVAYSSARHYAIFFQGTTPLTARLLTPALVDARSGRVDAVVTMPWYMKALLLAQPLHFGDYAGMAMKLLWAVLDLLTIAVLWTGLRLWLARGRAHAVPT